MSADIITAPRASTLIYGLVKGAPEGVWLLPANVCPAIPLALMQAKVLFEFIDIHAETLCIDTNLASQRIQQLDQPKVAGIIYVRNYGFAPNADLDLTVLRANLHDDAVLIDDQCLCTPILDWKKRHSNGANAIIFSTGYSKVIDLGAGGYGIFFNIDHYQPPTIKPEANAFQNINRIYKAAISDKRAIFADPTVSAALAPWVPVGEGPSWNQLKTEILAKLPQALAHKAQINAIYTAGLAEFSPLATGFQHWRFNIRVNNPRTVLAALFEASLFASDHYFPSSRLWGQAEDSNSLVLNQSIINLFNDQNFSIKQAEKAVQIIKQIAEKRTT